MAYQRKTRDEWEVQGYYGYGWERVTTEESLSNAKEMRRCYDENEPQYLHRIVKKRVRIDG